MRLLFLSHTHAFAAFRVGSHHLAREFALRGHDVVHYSTPLSLAHRVLGRVSQSAVSAWPSRAVSDDAGVRHLAPSVALPAGIAPPPIRAHLRRHGYPDRYDAVILDQPLLWSSEVGRLADVLVYRPTDLYPDGVKARLQRRILHHANGVVATSAPVLESLGTLDVPTLVLRNGVDLSSIPPPDDLDRPRTAVYVGAVDDRFDAQAVAAMAEDAPDWSIVIAGPGAVPSASMPPNVRSRGPISYADLPAVLHRSRVGLLPLSDHPLNAGRSPMKFYEYLASGLAVVTRATPVLRGESAIGVFAYERVRDIVPAFAAARSHASPNLAGRHAAEHMGWPAISAVLERFVRDLVDR